MSRSSLIYRLSNQCLRHSTFQVPGSGSCVSSIINLLMPYWTHSLRQTTGAAFPRSRLGSPHVCDWAGLYFFLLIIHIRRYLKSSPVYHVFFCFCMILAIHKYLSFILHCLCRICIQYLKLYKTPETLLSKTFASVSFTKTKNKMISQLVSLHL